MLIKLMVILFSNRKYQLIEFNLIADDSLIDLRVSEEEPLQINNQMPKTDKTVKIRKNFPETWIFESFELDSR